MKKLNIFLFGANYLNSRYSFCISSNNLFTNSKNEDEFNTNLNKDKFSEKKENESTSTEIVEKVKSESTSTEIVENESTNTEIVENIKSESTNTEIVDLVENVDASLDSSLFVEGNQVKKDSEAEKPQRLVKLYNRLKFLLENLVKFNNPILIGSALFLLMVFILLILRLLQNVLKLKI